MLYCAFGFVLFFLELYKPSEELSAHLSPLVLYLSFIFSHMIMSCWLVPWSKLGVQSFMYVFGVLLVVYLVFWSWMSAGWSVADCCYLWGLGLFLLWWLEVFFKLFSVGSWFYVYLGICFLPSGTRLVVGGAQFSPPIPGFASELHFLSHDPELLIGSLWQYRCSKLYIYTEGVIVFLPCYFPWMYIESPVVSCFLGFLTLTPTFSYRPGWVYWSPKFLQWGQAWNGAKTEFGLSVPFFTINFFSEKLKGKVLPLTIFLVYTS